MRLDKVKQIAKELMEQNNCNYSFKFDNAVSRFGRCDYDRGTISLSKNYCELNDEEQIRDTILHEIAHYLTQGEHHNKVWKAKAREIGCSGEVYVNEEAIRPPKKYKGTCKNCGKTIYRYRKMNTLACGDCCKKFNNNKYSREYLFEWTSLR